MFDDNEPYHYEPSVITNRYYIQPEIRRRMGGDDNLFARASGMNGTGAELWLNGGWHGMSMNWRAQVDQMLITGELTTA